MDIGTIITIAFFGIVAIITLLVIINPKKLRVEKHIVTDEDFKDSEPYELKTVQATLIDKRLNFMSVGHRYPKHIREFYLVFKTEEDEILELSVEQIIFDSYELNTEGSLALLNNEFYDFK